VLVKVEASGINPSDVASVQGRFPVSVLPRIVGRDFAGRVADGPAELVGTEVWGTGGDLGISRDGTHAEYLVIPQGAVACRPRNLSAEQAAVVGVPFVTAYSALFHVGHLREGEWVVVSGAAGAVGQAALQLAREKGAHSVALVRDASQDAVAESAGARAVAQSSAGNLEAVVREATKGRGAALALNGVGSSIFGTLIGALARDGRQVVYSAAGGREASLDVLSFYRNGLALIGLNTQALDVTRCSDLLREIAPLFESGALQPPAVGEPYPLTEAPRAYERVVSRGGGKVVLVVT
jgi:NADPH:quinone reductase-like Zn-dependent oxidoreductase